MPVKASYWDAWYEACKDDYFAWGTGGTYWDIPKFTTDSYRGTGAKKTKTAYTSCSKFGDTYKNGTMVAEVMWGGSFTYEKDESKAYAMTFTPGTANPNNDLFTDKEYPRECAGHEVNLTHPGVDIITASGFRTPTSPARSTGTRSERRRIRQELPRYPHLRLESQHRQDRTRLRHQVQGRPAPLAPPRAGPPRRG